MTHPISSLPSTLDREKIPILQVRTLQVRIEEPAGLIYLAALPEVSAKWGFGETSFCGVVICKAGSQEREKKMPAK